MPAPELDVTLLRAKLRTLQHRHRQTVNEYSELKERVQEYAQRRWMSAGEELEKRALQRAKLQRKDALAQLQRELDVLERTLAGLDSGIKTPAA